MDQPRFLGKSVFVTGGGSGIGRAIAVAFARGGAAVTVTGRRPGPLAETVSLIETFGGKATSVAADVSQSGEIEAAIQKVVEGHGSLDIAVNNAGMIVRGPVTEIDETEWNEVVAVNVTGNWLALKHEIIQMRRQGGGVIVNVGSTLGTYIVRPGTGAYGATKAALRALTRTAARECIADGIRINLVSAGPIDTHMSLRPGETDEERDRRVATQIPIGRVGTVEEVANAVIWLASPEASFAVGADLVLDGGNSG